MFIKTRGLKKINFKRSEKLKNQIIKIDFTKCGNFNLKIYKSKKIYKKQNLQNKIYKIFKLLKFKELKTR